MTSCEQHVKFSAMHTYDIPLASPAFLVIIGLAVTMNASAQQMANVRSFGAQGDGITDDRDAIQSAINSIQSGTVIIPYSSQPYLLRPMPDKSRFLNLKPNITL